MNIEAIKIDLKTSGLTQKQIAEKHNIKPSYVNKINLGYIHAEVEPKTDRQKEREARITQQPRPDRLELSLTDQEDLNLLFKHLNEKPGWPKIICVNTLNDEDRKWAIAMLQEKEHLIKVKLAKLTLMIDAIQRNDYSDLPPSSRAELEKGLAELKVENQEKILQSLEQPHQPSPRD